MFQEYYGFARVPFSKTIETDKLFATAGQKELTARLTYLVRVAAAAWSPAKSAPVSRPPSGPLPPGWTPIAIW